MCSIVVEVLNFYQIKFQKYFGKDRVLIKS